MSDIKKRPVILDCDPGEDDAVCMFMMLASQQFELLGITPVCGNKTLPYCEKNALRLLELTGHTEIPVYKGADRSMARGVRTAGNVHGNTGLGPVVLPEPKIQTQDTYAWEFIYEMAKKYPHELEILAVGPLTNLGKAFLLFPELPKLIKQVVIMGGAAGLGNWTAAAEFNIWADPEAAKIVFNAKVPMVMMALEICFMAYVSPDDLKAIRGDGTGIIANVTADLLTRRVDFGLARGAKGGILCDAVAATYMIDPSLIEVEEVEVDVDTQGELTVGKTVIARDYTELYKIKPNTKNGIGINREAFIDLLIKSVKTLDEKLSH